MFNSTNLFQKIKSSVISSRVIFFLNRWCLLISSFFLGNWILHGIFRCPFAIPFISCQNCPVISCPGQLTNNYYGFWGLWIILAILMGRTFCGWLCPVALINRITQFNKFRFHLSERYMSKIAFLKFIILGISLWFIFALNQPRLNIPIRTGNFIEAVQLTWIHATPLWQIRLTIIVILILLGFFISSIFCRICCPFGAILDLFNRFAPFKIKRDSNCNHCKLCKKDCPMETLPEMLNCTNCGDCLTKKSCPKHCIKFIK